MPIWRVGLALVCGLSLGACGGGGDDGTATSSTECNVEQARAGAYAGCLAPEAVARIQSEYRRRAAEATLLEPANGFDPRFYPTEVLAAVSALAEDRGDTVLADWVDGQLASLDARLTTDHGFLVWPVQLDGRPTFGSNSQSRLVIGLALLQRQRPTPRTLGMLRSAFRALDRMPRVDVRSSVTGAVHRLPVYAAQEVQAPVAASGRNLDPNQDAAMALAYALYAGGYAADAAEEQSARDWARQYLAATLDLAARPGCLPLADEPAFIDTCDTRYNGVWLAFALAAARLLDVETATRPVLATQYLLMRSIWLVGRTSRGYPVPFEGAVPDPGEPMLIFRAVLDLDDASAWPEYLRMLNGVTASTTPAQWPAGWLYARLYSDLFRLPHAAPGP